MKNIKLLTSTCVIIAGLYSNAFGVPMTTRPDTPAPTTTGNTATRAGSLRVQTQQKAAPAPQKTSTTATEPSRLSSLPAIGSSKVSVNSKMPTTANAAAIADLRSAIDELSLTTTSTTNALNSIQSGLDKLTEDYETVDVKIQEAKNYTDTKVGTLTTEKIIPLETDVVQIQQQAGNAATKAYVDQEITRVSTTAFNENQVKQAIQTKLNEENFKGYTDDKVAEAVAGINTSVEMQVTDEEVQYKSGNSEQWKRLAYKSDFAGANGADGADGKDGVTPIIAKDDVHKMLTIKYGNTPAQELISYAQITGPQGEPGTPGTPGDPGEPGQNACREMESVYTAHSDNVPGYLTIKVKDSCEQTVEEYKQEDKCVLVSLTYDVANPQDVYSCTPQAGSTSPYQIVKTNGGVSTAVKAVKTLVQTKVDSDDVVLVADSEKPNSFKVKFENALTKQVVSNLGFADADTVEATYVKKTGFDNSVKNVVTSEMNTTTGVIGQALAQKVSASALDDYLKKVDIATDETFLSALDQLIKASDAYSDVMDAKVAAVNAQSAAETAETAALAAQSAAETAQGLAETAKNTAQGYASDANTAKNAALSAQSDAETAKITAQSYASAAETAKNASQSYASDAATAKNDALAAKTDAEAAKTAAQGYASDAETAKSAAEGFATTASSKAAEAAESARQAAESASEVAP